MLLRTTLLALLAMPATGQLWVRDRGPGDLLPPALGGGPAMADLTVWQFGWVFQRDSLEPEWPVDPAAPAARATAVQALAAASKDADESLSALCWWGLARIGRHDHAAAARLQELVFAGALSRPAPVGDVAALALGFAARGDDRAITALVDLASDSKNGQTLLGGAVVPERLRCYAVYGLALAAEAEPDAKLQFRVLAAVDRLLLPGAKVPAELRMAALHAVVLLHKEAAPKLIGPMLQVLDTQWGIEEPKAYLSVRGQVPLAVAAMLGSRDPESASWRQRFAKVLAAADAPNAVLRSCAQALGRMLTAEQDETAEALRAAAMHAKDSQTRMLALFALGSQAGDGARDWALAALPRCAPDQRAWLALGIAAGLAARGQAAADPVVHAFTAGMQVGNPSWSAAYSVCLGLDRVPAWTSTALQSLKNKKRLGDSEAPVCAALGLSGDAEALPMLHTIAYTTSNAPLCNEAMAAMVRLDAKAQREEMTKCLLDANESIVRRHAAALALHGQGDGNCIESLAAVCADAKASLGERQFAAFALGSLGDASPRHWSAKLAASIDYRSCGPVLVGVPFGVLRLP